MELINKLISTEMPDLEITVFSPTREQQQAKASFWSFFMSGDVSVAPKYDLATALRYSRDKRMRQWWDLPGFQSWFHNKDEFRQKAEFLSNSALHHLEAILVDEKAQAGAKVQAIKLIMELSGKLSKSTDGDKFADEKISRMSRVELEEFIRNQSEKLMTQQEAKPN